MTQTHKIARAGEVEAFESHGQIVSYPIDAADTNGGFEWLEATIFYGAGPVAHIHHNADELFMILDGELTVKVGGEITTLNAGDVSFIPRGVPHSYTNENRDLPVRMVGLYTPAGLQEFLHQWEALFAAGSPDESAIAELTARFGQEAVGPPLAVELGLEAVPAY